jgi:uncharacterized membrane protein YozB (DUF420 family)
MLSGPGFLGTHASLLTDITLVLVLVVVALFTTGFFMARQKNLIVHRRIQTIAFITILVLSLTLMVPSFRAFVMNDSGGPRPHYFYVITTLHAVMGALGLLLGSYVVLGAGLLGPNVLPLKYYKGFMRLAFVLFLASALTGIWVYSTWYVSIPNPPGETQDTTLR